MTKRETLLNELYALCAEDTEKTALVYEIAGALQKRLEKLGWSNNDICRVLADKRRPVEPGFPDAVLRYLHCRSGDDFRIVDGTWGVFLIDISDNNPNDALGSRAHHEFEGENAICLGEDRFFPLCAMYVEEE